MNRKTVLTAFVLGVTSWGCGGSPKTNRPIDPVRDRDRSESERNYVIVVSDEVAPHFQNTQKLVIQHSGSQWQYRAVLSKAVFPHQIEPTPSVSSSSSVCTSWRPLPSGMSEVSDNMTCEDASDLCDLVADKGDDGWWLKSDVLSALAECP